MLIVYVETNFLMAIAKGQDLEAENLLSLLSPSIRVAIPSVCYQEALNVWELEERNRKIFDEQIVYQIKETRRDQTSQNAKSLASHLEQIKILNDSLLNDIKSRLLNIINRFLDQAELINVNKYIIQKISEAKLNEPDNLMIKNDIMDNLILLSILDHANSQTKIEKVFISGNINDFTKLPVKAVLRNAGIRYFTNTKDFLNWLNSNPSS